MGKSVTGRMPASPGIRACCMLDKEKGPLGPLSNILEPGRGTYRHVYGSGGLRPADAVGQMYTCAGGFIDFGHLRDVGDLTKFYYDALLLKRRKGDVIESPKEGVRGKITILKDVPAGNVEKQVDVARSIAYNESIFHEIETYWNKSIGAHHSSFSPEDLVSNFFGTYVSANAIRFEVAGVAGADYNTRFADQLEQRMTLLGAVAGAATEAALDRVEGTWFRGSHYSSGYLRRRNFAVWPLRPWLVDGLGGCVSTKGVFPSPTATGFAIPADASSYYTADYEVPKASRAPSRLTGIDAEVVNVSEFTSLIASIEQAASQDSQYGSDYNSPAPVGRIGP